LTLQVASGAKMKSWVFQSVGTLALAASLGPAAAADLPVKARPQAAAIYDWSGFYVGVHGGGGWGRKDISAPSFPFGAAVITPAASSNNISGWLAGGQIGYNFQGGPGPFGGRWVIGGEAQASWSRLDDTVACSAVVTIPGLGALPLNVNCSSKVDSLGTIALRFGSAFDRTLIYSKVGAAWTHDKYQDDVTTPAFAPLSFVGSETRWGWMVGAGIEYAFGNNWSGKIEYNYLDLGTETVRYSSVAPAPSAFVDASIRERVQVVKVGVNFHFGAGAVAAKY
jgi:outer membrane immunogenic protein